MAVGVRVRVAVGVMVGVSVSVVVGVTVGELVDVIVAVAVGVILTVEVNVDDSVTVAWATWTGVGVSMDACAAHPDKMTRSRHTQHTGIYE